MRFMVLMISEVYQSKGVKKTDAGFRPDAEMMAKMSKFNDDLKEAGELISLDGLRPLTTGARVAFSAGRPAVFHRVERSARRLLDDRSEVQTGRRRLYEALSGTGWET